MIEELQKIVGEIQARYGLTPEQVFDYNESESYIPLALFANRTFGIMEIVVKYLHENKAMKFSEIAKIISRDPRVVYMTYKNAKKKSIYIFRELEGFMVPVSVFREGTPLQALSNYCTDVLGLDNGEIAQKIGRETKAVWGAKRR